MRGMNMMARAWAACGLLVMAAVAASCGGSPTQGKWSDPTKIDFYSGLHVNLARMTRTASGAFYWDSIRGTGTVPVRPGDQVTVGYTLWLPDGTLVQTGSSATVTLDSANVIQGWVDAMPGAVQGTLRQMVIPPELGYLYGNGSSIPPNTTLVFLVSVDRINSASSSVVAAGDQQR